MRFMVVGGIAHSAPPCKPKISFLQIFLQIFGKNIQHPTASGFLRFHLRNLTAVPRKIRALWWAMALRQEDTGEWKYEVRSTKYEVKEIGATELRRGVGRRQSRNDVWGENPRTRGVEAPSVRRASVTRMEISIAAILKNFIGTGVLVLLVLRHVRPAITPPPHTLSLPLTPRLPHSPLPGFATSYFLSLGLA